LGLITGTGHEPRRRRIRHSNDRYHTGDDVKAFMTLLGFTLGGVALSMLAAFIFFFVDNYFR